MVENPMDLLEEIPAFASLIEPAVSLSPLERAVLRALSTKPQTAEMVVAQTRLPASCVENALANLVAKGAARSDGAEAYIRTSP